MRRNFSSNTPSLLNTDLRKSYCLPSNTIKHNAFKLSIKSLNYTSGAYEVIQLRRFWISVVP